MIIIIHLFADKWEFIVIFKTTFCNMYGPGQGLRATSTNALLLTVALSVLWGVTRHLGEGISA